MEGRGRLVARDGRQVGGRGALDQHELEAQEALGSWEAAGGASSDCAGAAGRASCRQRPEPGRMDKVNGQGGERMEEKREKEKERG